MHAVLKKSAAALVAGCAAIAVVGFLFVRGASAQELKHYDSSC